VEALEAAQEAASTGSSLDALRRLGSALTWLLMGEAFAREVATDICAAYTEAGLSLKDL
jgi:hypothetical protein